MSGPIERPAIEPMLLTVAETCTALRISRWTFYQLVQRQQLRTVQIGNARRVSVTALADFVAQLDVQEPAR